MHSVRFSPFSSTVILVVALVSSSWTALAADAYQLSPALKDAAGAEETETAIVSPGSSAVLYGYTEITEGCGPYFDGEECVYTFAGPGEGYAKVNRLRRGVVLRAEPVLGELRLWYKILFDEHLRYPERVAREQYVPGERVSPFFNGGVHVIEGEIVSTKQIVVDRSEQKLYAYEGGELFMESIISTGIELTPTPRGTFTVYKKMPTRYMQGPLPGISEKYYDLPGVPWNLYFTKEGGVIHGAYWHDKFGRKWSNGCVNLQLSDAKKLYQWADLGTSVIVQD